MTQINATPASLDLPNRNRMSIERISQHAVTHGVAVRRVSLEGAVDRLKLFTCPSLAPLSHASIFQELTPHQQRRYNQLVGMMQNELVCFFEQELAARVLPTILRDQQLPPDLAASLKHFLEEEQQHTKMFRRLNQLAEPRWYATSDYHILNLHPFMLRPLRFIAAHPSWFPMVFWVMLLMEERSLMISRRYAALDAGVLDPSFAETYRAHAEDEVRHVQLDWHLLERFYESRPTWLRRINAKLLEWFVVGLFLKPRRANVRLIDLLVAEFPDLAPKHPRLVQAVRNLNENAGYRRLMYSAESTPIGRSLFDRLPEFARLRQRLYAEDAQPTADAPETADQGATARLPDDAHRIPNALNAVIVTAQLLAIFACFWAASVLTSPWQIGLLAAGFALLMVGVYSVIHEAEHGVLFSHARANVATGIIIAAFFPGPFHLLRQGHVGHHLRNRSDDEAFDLWFEGESPVWKWVQWIGILTGGFYLMIVLSNLVVLALPFLLKRKWFSFDRPSAAFMDALNPRYARWIQLEAAGVVALHVAVVWLMRIPLLHYVALYAAFGFLWSALQYLHHFATERHVTRGARNVWIGWPIDKLWLNHNWHRTHHEHPTLSWIHLERIGSETSRSSREKREFLPWVYLRMWRGPRKATERVANRFAGKVIR